MANNHRAVCVLGRAMNLHNIPESKGDQFTDRPAVQIVLGVVGVVSFFALFIL